MSITVPGFILDYLSLKTIASEKALLEKNLVTNREDFLSLTTNDSANANLYEILSRTITSEEATKVVHEVITKMKDQDVIQPKVELMKDAENLFDVNKKRVEALTSWIIGAIFLGFVFFFDIHTF